MAISKKQGAWQEEDIRNVSIVIPTDFIKHWQTKDNIPPNRACYGCGYVWGYSGKGAKYITCPKCDKTLTNKKSMRLFHDYSQSKSRPKIQRVD